MEKMKLYVLDCGYQTNDMNSMLASYTVATVENPNPGYHLEDIPTNAFLIKHPEAGWILIDTAIDPNWKKNWLVSMQIASPYTATEEQLFPNRLKQLSVNPDDIKAVIMSHLHVDHCGCLHMFKNAKVYVDEGEFTGVLEHYYTGEGLTAHMPSDIKMALEAGLHWSPVTDETPILEICKGVKILKLGSGHSFGMLAVHLTLDSGKQFLIVADSIYMEETVKPTLHLPGNIYDTLGFKRTARYLLNYAKETGAEILYGHDMKQFKSLIHSTEGYYE